jgi:hypothetical protein
VLTQKALDSSPDAENTTTDVQLEEDKLFVTVTGKKKKRKSDSKQLSNSNPSPSSAVSNVNNHSDGLIKLNANSEEKIFTSSKIAQIVRLQPFSLFNDIQKFHHDSLEAISNSKKKAKGKHC